MHQPSSPLPVFASCFFIPYPIFYLECWWWGGPAPPRSASCLFHNGISTWHTPLFPWVWCWTGLPVFSRCSQICSPSIYHISQWTCVDIQPSVVLFYRLQSTSLLWFGFCFPLSLSETSLLQSSLPLNKLLCWSDYNRPVASLRQKWCLVSPISPMN